MNVFTTQALPGVEKQALLPDLWASFFLVVPLVSTTFASVNRMLGKLPLESLGWLLVDEAGQALPQAAVGVLLRTRRAVIVGDPVQIEPVVILPDTLTHTICRRFGVDPDHYAAPSASVQTLADAASAYTSEFETIVGCRSVGVPLLSASAMFRTDVWYFQCNCLFWHDGVGEIAKTIYHPGCTRSLQMDSRRREW